MRFLLIVAAYAALTVSAYAQQMKDIQEVLSPRLDVIKLEEGQVRTFQFKEGVTTLSTPIENLVEIVPQSDRTFSFRGIKAGTTIVRYWPLSIPRLT